MTGVWGAVMQRRFASAATTTAVASTKKVAKKRSLALNVHFRQPDFGMTKYEILSRATAFLLNVDPPNDPSKTTTATVASSSSSSTYAHLEASEQERKSRKLKQEYSHEPAGGPPRHAKDLGWLEFCTAKYRPTVHCVTSSHVLAPWLWKNYYPQDWLRQVEQKHCAYSLEIFDPDQPEIALAKFALSPFPIHHPNGMDLAIIHLKQEETEPNKADDASIESSENKGPEEVSAALGHKRGEVNDDERIFFPFSENGSLIFASPERILASTERPLPEGLCGGPALDLDGDVCGVVEGIVPMNHENKSMAGAASFIPSPRIRDFLDFAEHEMLQKIVPDDVFKKVVNIKAGNELNANEKEMEMAPSSSSSPQEGSEIEGLYGNIVESMRKHHTVEEVDAILATVDKERKEVTEYLEKEGGDVDEAIAMVRERANKGRAKIMNEIIENKESTTDKGK
eukprot:scaffold332750_cov51-Attheya_sp.AAC.1